MKAIARLRAMVENCPPGTMLPVSSFAALLDEVDVEMVGRGEEAGTPLADLTAIDIARTLGRSPSTVRGWLEAGDMPGAYRFQGREWRVSRADFAAFLERKRAKDPARPIVKRTRAGRTAPVDLGAWRKLGSG